MALDAHKTIISNYPYDQIVNAIHHALTELGASNIDFDTASGICAARKRPSFRSYGEKISIRVTNTQAGFQIDIESQNAFPLQIGDWGKNEDNVNRLKMEIETYLLENGTRPSNPPAWRIPL